MDDILKKLSQEAPSHITRIKVKFFNSVHDIIIDWDHRSSFKQSQVIEQIEAITGIPKTRIRLLGLRRDPDRLHPPIEAIESGFSSFIQRATSLNIFNYEYWEGSEENDEADEIFKRQLIHGCFIEDDATYALTYQIPIEYCEHKKRFNIVFWLIREDLLEDGACQPCRCISFNNESVFNILKKRFFSGQLEAVITELFKAGENLQRQDGAQFMRYKETILKNFNVLQYLKWKCNPIVGFALQRNQRFSKYHYHRERG